MKLKIGYKYLTFKKWLVFKRNISHEYVTIATLKRKHKNCMSAFHSFLSLDGSSGVALNTEQQLI